jgi:competence protein ComEA
MWKARMSKVPVSVLIAALVASGAAFPDRPGKKTVENLCGKCHGLQIMAAMRKNKAGWQATVTEMVNRGMEAEDKDLETVTEYLARYLSRYNVNKASAADLADVLELPAPQAQAIVDYRAKNGDFKSLDDLAKVPGLDVAKLRDVRDRIGFSGS